MNILYNYISNVALQDNEVEFFIACVTFYGANTCEFNKFAFLVCACHATVLKLKITDFTEDFTFPVANKNEVLVPESAMESETSLTSPEEFRKKNKHIIYRLRRSV